MIKDKTRRTGWEVFWQTCMGVPGYVRFHDSFTLSKQALLFLSLFRGEITKAQRI